MYKDYLRERTGQFMLENEKGFAIYEFMDIGIGSAVYIQDIYVKPEFRNQAVASNLSNEIQEIAKGQGHTYLLGTVATNVPNATASVKVLLAHGMSVFKSETDLIWFFKELI